jgi:dihydroxy-acid dehydratase
MSCVAEVLGLSIPGNSTMDASDKRLGGMAYKAGRRIVKMIEQGLTARKIITEKSIENAIIADLALAGSTNLFLHIPAIAYEAELDRDWWSFWDEMSHKIPLLLAVMPSGPYSFKDFHLAGGMKAFMSNLLPHLHGECLMVTGKTVLEEYANSPVYDREVIRSLDNPVSRDGGIAVLKGNIAPEGAVVKVAACPPQCFKFDGNAVVFTDVPSAERALAEGKFQAGDVIVIKYQGPKGNLGATAVTFQTAISFSSLYDKVAIVTDGRFSGGSHGLSIGYISPEASGGGPLAVVRDGDRIHIDIKSRTINVELSDQEIEERLKDEKLLQLDEKKHLPMLRIFARNITSTAKGATWTRWSTNE